jgi:hypothetical protein
VIACAQVFDYSKYIIILEGGPPDLVGVRRADKIDSGSYKRHMYGKAVPSRDGAEQANELDLKQLDQNTKLGRDIEPKHHRSPLFCSIASLNLSSSDRPSIHVHDKFANHVLFRELCR